MGGSGTGSNSFGMANLLGTQGQQHGSAAFLPFFSRDTVSDFMEAVTGKRRKRRFVLSFIINMASLLEDPQAGL